MCTASPSQSPVIRFLFRGPIFCPGSHLSPNPGLTVPPSPLPPLHLILIGCHYFGESPTITSRGRYSEAPHRSLFKEGFGLSSVCFGLDLSLSPAHARQGPPLGYIPKLRKLGRSSGESTGRRGGGALVLFPCYFFTDRVQMNSSCLLLSAPTSVLSPGVHFRSQSHAEHHLAHCSDCLSLE